MPKKRATKAAANRAKPKLKDVDGEDALSVRERETKKKGYMEDCDLYMKRMEEEFDEQLKLRLTEIDKGFTILRMQQGPNAKHMTVEECILSIMELEKEEERDTFDTDSRTTLCTAQSTLSILNSLPTPSKSKPSRRSVISKYKSKRTIKPTIGDSTVKKRTRGTKKSQAVTFNAEPESVSTAQSSFITPAIMRNATGLGWNTPLITPKFDPRLPITPAQRRNAKPGEIAISLAGSPLNVEGNNNNNKNSLMVNRKGKTLQIQVPDEFENILDNFDIPDTVNLETGSEDNVQKMMSMFAMIMKKSESDSDSK